jgi:hypothetical protein
MISRDNVVACLQRARSEYLAERVGVFRSTVSNADRVEFAKNSVIRLVFVHLFQSTAGETKAVRALGFTALFHPAAESTPPGKFSDV